MKIFTRGSNEAVKKRISKIDPLKRMWIFGLLILAFSLLAEPKIIPAILLFMLFLTYAQHRGKKRTLKELKQALEIELEDIEQKMVIINEHIDGGHATLDEKLTIQEMQETQEEYIIEYENCAAEIVKMELLEEKFKNFLVKLKKPSKLFTTGKKEKTQNKKEKN